MPRPTQNTARLTAEITQRLAYLSTDLHQLPADEAVRVIARILNPDDGILGAFTQLVEAGSRLAQQQAERGALPTEVWLSLGRAANELHSIGLDLDDHKDTLVQFGTQAGLAASKPPAPAPLVARRRR
ncbi:hypothetical protein [Streptomyces sp. SP2-10]|uniref:hypothetical protein n=1 Tax=Streptomyces sp. SP2-10 TaxID=2873385 RepID=UPI001CA75BFB|nr:hypothetical protein [Streptomyces sp. SP2-10]MBY8847100.1 hypothetical protein [Streptomyces sp. SP2-10]